MFNGVAPVLWTSTQSSVGSMESSLQYGRTSVMARSVESVYGAQTGFTSPGVAHADRIQFPVAFEASGPTPAWVLLGAMRDSPSTVSDHETVSTAAPLMSTSPMESEEVCLR